MKTSFQFGWVGLLVVALAGCAHRPINARLPQYDPAAGYYFHTQPRTNNSDELLFIATFSGGGTRAAALSCGVLEELARTSISAGGGSRRLLDEVDAISSVSGGSVTAAAYALYGDEAFGRLQAHFLKRDIQGDLVWNTLNPFHWGRLCSPTYGRSDMAAEHYDRILFHGATFGDLGRRPGPFLTINATDISTGARFAFTQYQFDLICSDLARYPLSRAVAASSAVPALLSPITLNNYAGDCGCVAEWVQVLAAQTNGVSRRASFHAMEVASYQDRTNRPYLHLVDGGLSDNLGVRAVLDGLLTIEANPELAQTYAKLDKVKRIVILCVNAYSSPEKQWDRRAAPPGVVELALAAATIPMDRYSFETLEAVKEQVENWRRRVLDQTAGAGARPRQVVEFYPILLGFNQLGDPLERRYFLDQPTSFKLPAKAVDRLREVAGRLLRESPEYQRLLRELH